MEDTVPSPQERMDAARERVRAVLAPETGLEKSIVSWLQGWDLPTVEAVAEMTERAVKHARAQGYDHGYHEAMQYARERGIR